jgi:hypothetical protein
VTGPRDSSAAESEQRLQQATAELENLRQRLLRAGAGESDPAEVRAALAQYWHAHGPVLVAVATAVGEQVRAQALEALYQWRAEVARATRVRR